MPPAVLLLGSEMLAQTVSDDAFNNACCPVKVLMHLLGCQLLTSLESVHQTVLVSAAQLPQDHNHLDLRDVLVPDAVVAEGRPWERVTSNGNACTER